jgi:hypothetical protein
MGSSRSALAWRLKSRLPRHEISLLSSGTGGVQIGVSELNRGTCRLYLGVLLVEAQFSEKARQCAWEIYTLEPTLGV